MSASPYYRKIIQIAVSPGDEEDTVYALASDGTVWRVVLATDESQWFLLPDLPEPDDDIPAERFKPAAPEPIEK